MDERKVVVAFFDLDHTLLDGSSGNIYALLMVRNGQMRARSLFWVIWYSILYRLNRLPKREVYMKVLEVMGQYPVLEMIEMMDYGFEKMIMPRLFKGGVEIVKRHKEMGHITVVATAAGEYVAERVRVQLGADGVIATPIPISGDRITGKLDGPTAFMDEKLEMARAYCESVGANLSDCYFYSDSASDLPLLAAVGHPVMVNPHFGLRIAARGKGWPVLKFKEHASFDRVRRPERFLSPEMDYYSSLYEKARAKEKSEEAIWQQDSSI